MAIEICGNWHKGFVYDFHTLDSTYLGCENGKDKFKNVRSEMGELVCKLKYTNLNQKERSSYVSKITDLLYKFKGLNTFDYFIPAPHSKDREFQLVYEIIKKLGEINEKEVLLNLICKSNNTQIKDIYNSEDKNKILSNSITFCGDYDNIICSKNILIFDDIYSSGATLTNIVNFLKENTKVNKICVLALTKTKG